MTDRPCKGSILSPGVDFASLQLRDFTIRKGILWESESASDSEAYRKEVEFIRQYRSNNPAVGYNRWPKFKGR